MAAPVGITYHSDSNMATKRSLPAKIACLNVLCPPCFGLTIINRRNRLSPQLTVREIHLKFNLHRSYCQGLPKHTLTV